MFQNKHLVHSLEQPFCKNWHIRTEVALAGRRIVLGDISDYHTDIAARLKDPTDKKIIW